MYAIGSEVYEGLWSFVTGSGPGLVFAFRDEDHIKSDRAKVRKFPSKDAASEYIIESWYHPEAMAADRPYPVYIGDNI
jgi:hypothetical protein